MSKQPAARLGEELLVRKGEATPATRPANPPAPAAPTPASRPRGLSGTIAVTLRLDPERYGWLKEYGFKHRLTNQELLVAALDAYRAAQERG